MSNIVQFGLGRTGSTLIYRILKQIYPDVMKCHLPEIPPYLNSNAKIIVSIRHPIESFLSFIRVHEFPDSKDNINFSNEMINTYINGRYNQERRLAWILKNYKDKILVLKYEKFYEDFDYTFDKLEKYLDVKIDTKHREDIKQICSISNSIKIQNNLDDFYESDKDTGIHGHHIMTPNLKETFKFIDNTQLRELENIFEPAIQEWAKY
jgi:hypothetical protein